MYDAFLTLISRISDLMWGPWTMIFIAFVSVYLTVRTRFFQVTHFVYILRNTFGRIFDRSGDKNSERMTPFQATATSLAGTVGMGNMAGVATALSIGGPGAIFWMWVLTFCLSTQVGFFVYFETALVSLLGEHVFGYIRWIYFLPGVVFAGITNVDQLWALANISVAASALPNLVALLILSGVFITLMKDFLSGENKYATHITDKNRQYVRIAGNGQEELQ